MDVAPPKAQYTAQIFSMSAAKQGQSVTSTPTSFTYCWKTRKNVQAREKVIFLNNVNVLPESMIASQNLLSRHKSDVHQQPTAETNIVIN